MSVLPGQLTLVAGAGVPCSLNGVSEGPVNLDQVRAHLGNLTRPCVLVHSAVVTNRWKDEQGLVFNAQSTATVMWGWPTTEKKSKEDQILNNNNRHTKGSKESVFIMTQTHSLHYQLSWLDFKFVALPSLTFRNTSSMLIGWGSSFSRWVTRIPLLCGRNSKAANPQLLINKEAPPPKFNTVNAQP